MTAQELVPGSTAFKRQVEDILGRQTEEQPRGRPGKDSHYRAYQEKMCSDTR
jgi:hypothetical protein